MNVIKEQNLRNDLFKAIDKIVKAHYDQGTFENIYATDSLPMSMAEAALRIAKERELYFQELVDLGAASDE